MLSPLIYIIYVNDVLTSLTERKNIFMYADDMLILSRNIDIVSMYADLQCKLDTVANWCRHNKLTINRNKTKCMVISSRTSDVTPSLKIGDHELNNVTSYEYLGMMLDNKLSMSQQIDNMHKKSNMRLGILCKIRRYITEKMAERIYKTMIRPHLEYIDFIVESGTKEHIEKLNKLQDKALRRIEFCKNMDERSDYDVLRSKYRIENLDVRRKRSLLRIMYDKSRNNENIEV